MQLVIILKPTTSTLLTPLQSLFSPDIDGCRELFRWAATLLTSRGFPEILTREDAEQVPQLQRYLNEPGFKIEVDPNAPRSRIAAIGDRYTNPSLIPLLDSLNHRPRERITWRVGNGQLGFETVDGLPPGVEVYNNYGAKPNEERRSPDIDCAFFSSFTGN